MNLLISVSFDLFKIHVLHFYKCNSQELKNFKHANGQTSKNVTQNSNDNMAMMPIVEQDSLAIGQDLSSIFSDFNSST
jgi:hypothetical protein